MVDEDVYEDTPDGEALINTIVLNQAPPRLEEEVIIAEINIGPLSIRRNPDSIQRKRRNSLVPVPSDNTTSQPSQQASQASKNHIEYSRVNRRRPID
jgi:hypothetical protein